MSHHPMPTMQAEYPSPKLPVQNQPFTAAYSAAQFPRTATGYYTPAYPAAKPKIPGTTVAALVGIFISGGFILLQSICILLIFMGLSSLAYKDGASSGALTTYAVSYIFTLLFFIMCAAPYLLCGIYISKGHRLASIMQTLVSSCALMFYGCMFLLPLALNGNLSSVFGLSYSFISFFVVINIALMVLLWLPASNRFVKDATAYRSYQQFLKTSANMQASAQPMPPEPAHPHGR